MSGLTNKQRMELFDACRGDRQYPNCNICGQPIQTGQKWHASHNPLLPRALGGDYDGVAHDRCNLEHAHQHDVPLIAKNDRIRQKHAGAWRTSRPMVGSAASDIKIPFRGPPIDRRTGQPWRGR